ncbi:MAG: hypothetical protein ACRC6V_06705 [Bacteroidales bacterium]
MPKEIKKLVARDSLVYALRTLHVVHDELTTLTKELNEDGVETNGGGFGDDVPEFNALFTKIYELAAESGIDTTRLP